MERCNICNRCFDSIIYWIINPRINVCLECSCGIYSQQFNATENDINFFLTSFVKKTMKSNKGKRGDVS